MKLTTSILLAVLFVGTTSFAAPAKKATAAKSEAATTSAADTKTILGSSSTGLKGLSVFGCFDMADSMSFSGAASVNATVDKGFGFGALYQTNQFSAGKFAQFGATYELERTVQVNGQSQSSKLSNIVFFGELALQMTQEFALTGGLNYDSPTVSNLNGASVKGKMGYQFGGSFLTSKNFAIDARYRNTEVEVSGGGQTATGKLTGLFFNARYIF